MYSIIFLLQQTNNLSGKLVYSGTETTIGGLARGIYIIHVAGQTFKVRCNAASQQVIRLYDYGVMGFAHSPVAFCLELERSVRMAHNDICEQ